MDNRAIGFFDSGLGGLTCIPNLFSQIPNEHVIYFGDTARTPYGSKAVSTIKHYANQIADFLYTKDVKMMVIACNTITATCLYDLQKRFPDIPIIATGGPTDESILATVEAGANAITWTPPSNGDVFKDIMDKYRHGEPHPDF